MTKTHNDKQHTARLTFRLSSDLLDDLVRFALGHKLTLSKAVRTLIEIQKGRAA